MGNSCGVRRRCCVVLDTNMLMLAYKGIDIFTQIEELLTTKCEFIVLRKVCDELVNILNKGSPKERKAAQYALKLVEKYCKIVDYEEPDIQKVDELILLYALNNKCFIASNDKELRRKARALGLPEIYFREEKQMLEASEEFI